MTSITPITLPPGTTVSVRTSTSVAGIGGVRIADMPDLGAFDSTSSVVGEKAGSGRFSASAISGYLGGPFLPLTGGTVTGPLNYTATGGTTVRSAQDRAADVANVLDFGADPTGGVDSAAAFNATAAVRRNGRPVDVFAPSGTYLLNAPITIGDPNYSQRLYGDGWSTILTVGPGFSSTAQGVILILPTAYNYEGRAQPSVCDLQILFQQPPDFSTTATASTGIGGTTVTVASTTGIHVGSYCVDATNSGALPSQAITPKVTAIAGGVVTLDRATVGAISTGDVMLFAANRSQAVTLASSPSLAPGSPAIKYPWAIYTPLAQSIFIDHVLVAAAWNGIYIRGSSFAIGQYFVGCLNIGLDIDQCHNFPKIDHLMLHNAFGISAAMAGVYYDGQTIAANIGACDGLVCDALQSWCGIVNLTVTWSWGSFSQLNLDGDNANLNIVSTNPNGWLQIAEFYRTCGRNSANGPPLLMNSPSAVFIGNAWMTVAPNLAGIQVTNGRLTIASGYMYNGVGASHSMIEATAGVVSLSHLRFDSDTGRTVPYVLGSGSASIALDNCAFVQTPGAGAAGVFSSNAVTVNNVAWNGWKVSTPGLSPNNGSVFVSPLDANSIQAGCLSFAVLGAANHSNTGFGVNALATVADTTVNSTAVGAIAGYGAQGSGNTFLGTAAGYSVSGASGGGNTCLGAVTGYALTTGANNTIIGYNVATTLTTGSGNIYIGVNGGAAPQTAAESNTLRIGGTSANNVLAATGIDQTIPKVYMTWLPGSPSYASDAAAQAGGVAIGGLYRNGSAVMCRIA